MQITRLITLSLSLCLLSLQLSGLHLHVNISDSVSDSESHRPHLHDKGPSENEHDTDVDVDLTGAGITWKKYFLVLGLIAFGLLAVFTVNVKIWAPYLLCIPIRFRCHWRPYLRAPPLFPLNT